jgi:hypothetical protein
MNGLRSAHPSRTGMTSLGALSSTFKSSDAFSDEITRSTSSDAGTSVMSIPIVESRQPCKTAVAPPARSSPGAGQGRCSASGRCLIRLRRDARRGGAQAGRRSAGPGGPPRAVEGADLDQQRGDGFATGAQIAKTGIDPISAGHSEYDSVTTPKQSDVSLEAAEPCHALARRSLSVRPIRMDLIVARCHDSERPRADRGPL